MKIIPVDTQIAIRWLKLHSHDTGVKSMCEWVRLYTGCSVDSEIDLPYIYDHAEKLFVEYLTACNNPGSVVKDFLDKVKNEEEYHTYQVSAINSIVRVLRGSQVRCKSGEYVNGFTDISKELCEQYKINV